MNAELQSRQEQIVEEFSFYEDWMEKYEQLIDMGKELAVLSDEHRQDEHLIRGCQSRVWLSATRTEEKHVRFYADSDAIITKGLVALMVRVLDGLPAKDIAESDLWFIEKIGLDKHLSPTRANGLHSMVQQMKRYGVAFQAK
jgi:cysteine desulfuration protein SufE|tara:strand:- start:9432 stop:9857 length:426 start_codon:yes stop_codon:yes gene_type:complete